MGTEKGLKKSKDKVLAGVAGGIAEFLDWEPRQIRAAWILGGIVSAGTALIAYAICAFVFPEPDDFDIDQFRVQ